jgi:RND family efflux transporter MFP subunit
VKAIQPSTQLGQGVTRVSGVIRSKHEATLSAQSTGTLVRVLAKVGDKVKKGDLLAQLDPTAARIGLEQARASSQVVGATYDGARIETDRARALAATGSISRAGLEKAEIGLRQIAAQVAQSDAALSNAQRVLRESSIKAPFDGVITARLKGVGDTVSGMPPTPILSMVDTESLEVLSQVPEALIDDARRGANLVGTLSPSGAQFDATITNLGAVIDPQSRTVELLADVRAREGNVALRPGALVEIEMSPRGEASASSELYLPSQAISTADKDAFVWVVAGGKAERRGVSVRQVVPGYVRVLGGLDATSLVVADASLPIQEGTLVQVFR